MHDVNIGSNPYSEANFLKKEIWKQKIFGILAQKFQMGKIDISLNGKTVILISWLEVKNG